MTEDKRTVPELRFKAEDGSEFPEWEEKKLGEIADRVTRKNKNNESDLPLTISAQEGLVSQTEFFTKKVASRDVSGYYLLKKGDFAYNKSYSAGYPWGAIKRLTKHDKGVVSTLYICFAPVEPVVNSDYLEQYFDSGVWNHEVSLIAVEGARNHGLLNIPIGEFFETVHLLPSLPEQKKIAEFFSLLDERISKQADKVASLREYKKGLSQRIFSRELRFKDENGEDYPEWEEKKLGEVLTERKETSSKGAGIPHATLGTEGLYLKTDRYNRDFLVRTEDKQYKVTKKNDICYNPANLKFGVISRNKIGTAIFSPIYVTFEVNQPNSPEFFEAFMCRWDFINKVRKYEEGTVYERQGVKANDFLRFSIPLPSLPEQKKIAALLSTMDSKIAKEEEKLAALREQKRGLMQRMFA